MYHIGMTQWIVGDERLEDSCERLHRFGYDGIEFAAEPDKLNAAECRELMERYHLDCRSLCGIFGANRDLTSNDAAGKNAVAYLRGSVDFARAVGAGVMIAVPSPVGRVVPPSESSPEQLWDTAVANLRQAGKYALDHGVCIAIEALNRYETFFINTIEQASALARAVDLPSVGVMADLFHMSIEEASLTESLSAVSGQLMHVHVADSNREPAGFGHTDFIGILRTLQRLSYAGSLTMEFMYRVADPYSASGIRTQPNLMDAYAEQAIRFIRAAEQCAAH